MKHIRKLIIFVVVIVIISAFTGCAKKEFSEVYTKVSDQEITLLSQESQLVVLDITVEEESKISLEKTIEIKADEARVLKLEDITDISFFKNNPKITNVEVVAQRNAKADTEKIIKICYWSLIGVLAISLLISIIISDIEDIRRDRRRYRY